MRGCSGTGASTKGPSGGAEAGNVAGAAGGGAASGGGEASVGGEAVGEVVAVGENIEWQKVVPVWPEVGSAAVVPIVDHIDQHLASALADLRNCLRAVEEWPSRTPRSKVFADDREWYETVRAAYKRGMMAPVSESELFRNQFGEPVLNGAMAVPK